MDATATSLSMANHVRDMRFRRMVDSVTAQVMAYHAPRHTSQDDAQRSLAVALDAATTMLKLIYEDDRELKELRAMVEQLAENAITLANYTPTVLTIDPDSKELRPCSL